MTGTVHRFFVAPGTVAGRERLPLPEELEHQVRRVLRLRDGAEIVLLEGDGDEARCVIAGGELVVTERRPSIGEPRHRLTVVQALLKGDGLEEAIRAATEVGVAAFQLAVTERTVARELSPRRLERLRTVAREAAEQSERGMVPPVDAPRPLPELIGPGTVLLWERGGADQPGLASVDAASHLVIGPEGGFTRDEVAAAQRGGATLAGLGPRILRAESVAPVAAAIVLSRAGDFA
ncbi:MAG: RsmE family RNA methyltransferase [Chloroflexota bacterium]